MPIDTEDLIQRHGLIPHPEGGWYREQYRSTLLVQRPDGSSRAALTAILFLLKAGEISRWHRVAAADETWHFAGGDPLELFTVSEPDGAMGRQLLGGAHDGQALPLAVVPAGCWQAARTTGAWSLVSCCVGPGFDFADFTLLRDCPRDQWPPSASADFL